MTVTETRDAGTHTDVSLWFVIAGRRDDELAYDAREMRRYQWRTLHDVLATDIAVLDPHMHRFVRKMLPIVAAERRQT